MNWIGEFALLGRDDACRQITWKPTARVIGNFGELIAAPGQDGMLWVEIKIERTLIGKLLNLIYKGGQPAIDIIFDDNSSYSGKMPAEMAASGFLLSPFIKDTPQFVNLLSSLKPEFMGARKVIGIKVRVNHQGLEFYKEIKVDFFTLQLS
jgi:hypothetical protein